MKNHHFLTFRNTFTSPRAQIQPATKSTPIDPTILSQNTTDRFTSDPNQLTNKLPEEPPKKPHKKTQNILFKAIRAIYTSLFKCDPLLFSLWPLFCLFTSIMIGYILPFIQLLNNPSQHPFRTTSLPFAGGTILIFPGSAYFSLYLAVKKRNIFLAKCSVFLMILNALFSIPFSLINLRLSPLETDNHPLELSIPLTGLLICYNLITTFSMINHAYKLKKTIQNPAAEAFATATTTRGDDFSTDDDDDIDLSLDLEDNKSTKRMIQTSENTQRTEMNDENIEDRALLKKQIKQVYKPLKTFKKWGLCWVFLSFAYSLTSTIPLVLLEVWNSQKGENASDLVGFVIMLLIVFIVIFQIYVHQVFYLAVRYKNLAKTRDAVSVLKFNAILALPISILNTVLILMKEKSLFKKQVFFLQINHHTNMALINYQMIKRVEKILEEGETLKVQLK